MIERIFSHFDIAQICLLSFLKAASKLLIFIGSRLYFSATIEFSFSFFFFNENNNADIFNDPELILEIKWSINLKKILLE